MAGEIEVQVKENAKAGSREYGFWLCNSEWSKGFD